MQRRPKIHLRRDSEIRGMMLASRDVLRGQIWQRQESRGCNDVKDVLHWLGDGGVGLLCKKILERGTERGGRNLRRSFR